MDENNKKFDIAQLLNFINLQKVNFSPKICQKLWDDAEILMLGALVKYLKEKGYKNEELKKVINERIENFEKRRKDKSYLTETNQENAELNEARIELDKIKKARDEINLKKFFGFKKLSEKTKKLLADAYKKATFEKSKKESIIIENNQSDKNKSIQKNNEISKEETAKVNQMLDIAVKSGIIKKQDLGLKNKS